MEFPLQSLKCMPPLLLVGVLGAFSMQVSAQEFPQKPIHIFTTEPGGGSDFAARIRKVTNAGMNILKMWPDIFIRMNSIFYSHRTKYAHQLRCINSL